LSFFRIDAIVYFYTVLTGETGTDRRFGRPVKLTRMTGTRNRSRKPETR